MPNINKFSLHAKNSKYPITPESFMNSLQFPDTTVFSKYRTAQSIKKEMFYLDDYSTWGDNYRERNDNLKKVWSQTLNRQALYVLKGIGKLKGKSDYVNEKLKDINEDNLTFKSFSEIYTDVLGIKKYDSKLDKDTEKKVQQIIDESCYVENIGKSSEDPALIEWSEYNYDTADYSWKNEYKEKALDVFLDTMGYTKKDLNRFDNNCFTVTDEDIFATPPKYKQVIFNENFRKIREELIIKKMNSLPKEERTATRFADECDKINVAMESYVLYSKNGLYKDSYRELPDYGTRERYTELSNKCIDMHANAQSFETTFNDNARIITEKPYLNESTYKEMFTSLTLLKETHSKRSWFTRFVDYFRSKGEDSTIKRMEKKLAETEKFLTENSVNKVDKSQIEKWKKDILDSKAELENGPQKQPETENAIQQNAVPENDGRNSNVFTNQLFVDEKTNEWQNCLPKDYLRLWKQGEPTGTKNFTYPWEFSSVVGDKIDEMANKEFGIVDLDKQTHDQQLQDLKNLLKKDIFEVTNTMQNISSKMSKERQKDAPDELTK